MNLFSYLFGLFVLCFNLLFNLTLQKMNSTMWFDVLNDNLLLNTLFFPCTHTYTYIKPSIFHIQSCSQLKRNEKQIECEQNVTLPLSIQFIRQCRTYKSSKNIVNLNICNNRWQVKLFDFPFANSQLLNNSRAHQIALDFFFLLRKTFSLFIIIWHQNHGWIKKKLTTKARVLMKWQTIFVVVDKYKKKIYSKWMKYMKWNTF